jgi:hypothetical protein
VRAPLFAVTLVLAAATASAAEDWTQYTDRQDRFSVNLPGIPTIAVTLYQPQRGMPVPARVHRLEDGPRRYSVTVIDLTTIKEPSDVKGSIAWEAWNFRKRGGDVTYDAYAQVDRIEGHHLNIRNPDGTVTIVAIHLHGRRLYVLEATVPPNTPGAVHFQQSLTILDAQGEVIRYELDSDGNRARRVPSPDQ